MIEYELLFDLQSFAKIALTKLHSYLLMLFFMLPIHLKAISLLRPGPVPGGLQLLNL